MDGPSFAGYALADDAGTAVVYLGVYNRKIVAIVNSPTQAPGRPPVHPVPAFALFMKHASFSDAEGRLVLADALVEASSEMPDLIIDCATLTGGWCFCRL